MSCFIRMIVAIAVICALELEVFALDTWRNKLDKGFYIFKFDLASILEDS